MQGPPSRTNSQGEERSALSVVAGAGNTRRGFAVVGRFMQRPLTEMEKARIVEHEWAKARAKNPHVVMRVSVQDETDESGKPRVSVVIAF
jgi:hypothetical protein